MSNILIFPTDAVEIRAVNKGDKSVFDNDNATPQQRDQFPAGIFKNAARAAVLREKPGHEEGAGQTKN